jgi:hypothetical protein
MSYNVVLWCGCSVYVSCHPKTGIAHTRIVEARASACPVRRHEVGAHLWLWELLPEPRPAEAARGESRGRVPGRQVGEVSRLSVHGDDDTVEASCTTVAH